MRARAATTAMLIALAMSAWGVGAVSAQTARAAPKATPKSAARAGTAAPAKSQAADPAAAVLDKPAWRPSDAQKAEAREIFRRVIGFDTSEEGGQTPALAAWLADQFKAAGFPAEDIHVLPLKLESGKTTASLVVRYRAAAPKAKPIDLIAHMDVVNAHRADWERDPFTLVEEKGYFFGRGTLDNKAGVALLTATFLQLKRDGFRPSRDLIIAFSGDEELGGETARSLLSDHRDLVDAEFVLNADIGQGKLDDETGAATSYTLQTAEKTYASFTLTARNPGGHSSQPRADNAIYDVMEALARIRARPFPVQWNATTLAYFKAAGPLVGGKIGAAMTAFAAKPGDAKAVATLSASPFHAGAIRTTCIPTLLKAGHADNALPQSAVATVNCRIFPGVAIADVQAKLQQIAGAKIAVAPLDKYFSSDASPLRDDVLAATAKAVHASYPKARVIPGMSLGASDSIFYRNAGMPSYGVAEYFLKDTDDFAHGLNERLPVESFYNGLTHWRVLIDQLAG